MKDAEGRGMPAMKEEAVQEKRALIFGAGGFVGSYLVRELCENGYEVYGSDMPDIIQIDGLAGYEPCDLLDPDAVEAQIRKIMPTHIFNLAGMSSVGQSWKEPQLFMEVNTVGALNILEAVRGCSPAARVLFIGSSEEYEPKEEPLGEDTAVEANNPYGISKAALEDFVTLYRKEYGLKVYHVRAFNHTGIGQRDSFVIPSWCRQAAQIARSGKPGQMRVGNLSVRRDFSDVRDIVRAYRMIIESDGCEKTYNVGSGKAHALKDILDYIISLSAEPVEIVVDEERIRAADNPVICCDHTRITEELGWEPEHDIFDTIKEMYEYYYAKA